VEYEPRRFLGGWTVTAIAFLTLLLAVVAFRVATQSITRAVWEIGGRIGVGNQHIEADFGFGFRIMGGASRGRDVTNFIDPDILTTFMLELGVTVRF
jgi:hypothetical protein